MTASADETAVRDRIEAWARAIRAHDLAGVVRHHTPNLVYFDVPPPLELLGLDSYEESWPPFFDYIGTTGDFELEELSVSAGTEVAFAHALLCIRGEGEAHAVRVRLTIGLRKIAGEWTISHEHHSVPYTPQKKGNGGG
jgi:ketosteroid isomerase-like protein